MEVYQLKLRAAVMESAEPNVSKAELAIKRLVLEGRLVELDLLEQAINTGWDMNKFKLYRLAKLQNELDQLNTPAKLEGKNHKKGKK